MFLFPDAKKKSRFPHPPLSPTRPQPIFKIPKTKTHPHPVREPEPEFAVLCNLYRNSSSRMGMKAEQRLDRRDMVYMRLMKDMRRREKIRQRVTA
jgi:hypothetical protein